MHSIKAYQQYDKQKNRGLILISESGLSDFTAAEAFERKPVTEDFKRHETEFHSGKKDERIAFWQLSSVQDIKAGVQYLRFKHSNEHGSLGMAFGYLLRQRLAAIIHKFHTCSWFTLQRI